MCIIVYSFIAILGYFMENTFWTNSFLTLSSVALQLYD